MEYSADKVPGPEYGSHKGCDKQLTFSKTLTSEQYSLRMKIAYGCILCYVSLQTAEFEQQTLYLGKGCMR